MQDRASTVSERTIKDLKLMRVVVYLIADVGAEPNPCLEDSDCDYYGHCVDHQCTCNRVCPAIYAPVCGSDWHTYSNLCELQSKACHEKTMIYSVHQGPCGKSIMDIVLAEEWMGS